MVFVQLRVSLAKSFKIKEEELTKLHKFEVYKVIKEIVKDSDGDYTVGYEVKNKFNETIAGHFHACYELEDNPLKDTLQKKIKKQFKALCGVELKGNKCYAVQLIDSPTDYYRWIRYPLKETPIKDLCLVKDKALDDLIMLAKDERERSSEASIARRLKAEQTTTFKEKMFAWLEENKVTGSQKAIYLKVDEYYVQEGKPLNFNTMLGYVDNYMRVTGLLTASQFYDLNKK